MNAWETLLCLKCMNQYLPCSSAPTIRDIMPAKTGVTVVLKKPSIGAVNVNSQVLPRSSLQLKIVHLNNLYRNCDCFNICLSSVKVSNESLIELCGCIVATTTYIGVPPAHY